MSFRDDGTPVILDLNSKIGTLERRLSHLDERLCRGGYRSSASANFDKAEVNALRDAVTAMRFCGRMSGPVSPLLEFERLLEVLNDDSSTDEQYDKALLRAEVALESIREPD